MSGTVSMSRRSRGEVDLTLAARVVAYLRVVGETAAAHAIGVDPVTLLRVGVGLPAQRSTITHVRVTLDQIDGRGQGAG